MNICINTQYLGGIWAGKILKDWNFSVIYCKADHQTRILITSDNQKVDNHEFDYLHIILTETQVKNAHSLARSGVLSTFGQKKEVFIPHFIVETVVANSLAIICMQNMFEGNLEYKKKIKVPVTQLLKYFGAFFFSAKENHLINNERGQNMLEGAAPYYSVYKAKEGHVAVGNLQPKFYKQMIRGLPLSQQQKQTWQDNQLSMDQWPQMREMLTAQFSKLSAKQWEEHFRKYDTCITQIKESFRSNIVEPKFIPFPKI